MADKWLFTSMHRWGKQLEKKLYGFKGSKKITQAKILRKILRCRSLYFLFVVSLFNFDVYARSLCHVSAWWKTPPALWICNLAWGYKKMCFKPIFTAQEEHWHKKS